MLLIVNSSHVWTNMTPMVTVWTSWSHQSEIFAGNINTDSKKGQSHK